MSICILKIIMIYPLLLGICDALPNLVPFVQSKKREKHPWRSINFSKVPGLKPATLLKLALLDGCFSRFLNCTNDTKSCNVSHISDQRNPAI